MLGFSAKIHTFFCQQWFSLKDVPSGSVHLRLEWLSLLSSAERLSEVRPKHISIGSERREDLGWFWKRPLLVKSSGDLSVGTTLVNWNFEFHLHG